MIHINSKKIITKKDIFIIAAILSVGIIALILPFITGKHTVGEIAVVSVNSKVIAEINLKEQKNGDFKIQSIEDVTFEVKDRQVKIKSSDCPDKICEKTGFISHTGEKIVCLPKRLVVEIKE